MRVLGSSLVIGLGALQRVRAFAVYSACFDTETGAEIDCAVFDPDFDEDALLPSVAEAGDEWDCDVRSWTRAPDLIPGHQIPGETRLWLNGTGCRDIERWELGLRLKERAIVKKRNYEVSFPVKPERKPWNASAHIVWEGPDMTDIYTGREYAGYMGSNDHDQDEKEFQAQMVAYNAAIRNKTLFEVHGQERVVFDTKLPLELEVDGDSLSSNYIRPFSVKVPLTNFPPIKANSYTGYGTLGKNEQMLNHETMSEYYHLLTLSNGTILDLAAGRTAFLTEPLASETETATIGNEPTMTPEEIEAQQDKEDPLRLNVEYRVPDHDPTQPRTTFHFLESPKNMSAPDADENDNNGPWGLGQTRNRGPSCDIGNKATFSVTVTPNVTDFVADHNVTLTVQLRRYGNGSEYPAFLDISLRTLETLTWAYNFVSNETGYQDLISPADSNGMRSSFSYTEKMLLALSDKALLEQQKQSAPFFGSTQTFNGRWPVSEDTVRYDFEEVYKTVGDREFYEFEVELSIPYDVIPNFQTTFTTFTPQLTFELNTIFLCGKKETAKEEPKSADEVLDGEWEEWRLEYIQETESPIDFYSNSMTHTGAYNIDIARPSSLDSARRALVVDYLNATARAPALSDEVISTIRSFDDEETLELVNLTTRDENESELRQSRYDLYGSQRRLELRCHNIRGPGACWRMNNGGGGMHAAKLWQRLEKTSGDIASDAGVRSEQVVYTAGSKG